MRKISLFIFFLVVPVSFIEAAISYIVTVQYNGTSASVHIPDEVSGVVRCISGTSSHVLLGQSSNTNNNQDEIIYALSGNTDDGEFSLSSTDNLTLNLKGLTLKNPRGEAIHVMGKRVKVSLAADTENMLSDGNGAVVEEGCFHCDGHTEFMGKGTLTVLSNMWCAIYSKEYLTLKNCTINVIGSMKDGVYCQEYFKMSSGVLKIDNVKDNGIKVEKRISNSNSQTNENSGNFYMTDGLLSIKNVGGDCIKTSGTITHSGGIFDFDTTNIKENSTETIIVPDFCIVNTGEVCAFFESPGNWTNTIHCWAWKDSPSENFTGGNWPGASCTLLGTAPNGNKVWKWIWDGKKQENSSAMQPAKIIFNNNGQPQTDDQTFTLGGYYNKYGLQGYAGESVVPSTPTDYSKQPFTIVAHNEDVTIRMIASSSESFEDVQFSTDKGQTWSGPGNTDLFYKVIPANTTLSLRGYFLRYLSSLEISGGTFDVEGNIASLRADYEERNKWHTYTGAINLKGLFSGHTNLLSAENLVLPSTTLTEGCYFDMFNGCTSLTAAPPLPATTLANSCYKRMFYGCTSLTTAPQLPATALTNSCYSCYDRMFYGCTSLTTAPQLPATTLAEDCYYGMFELCTSLTTAPQLPATTLANRCYSQMFYNCISLTTAPQLPATTLAQGCYGSMFRDCRSLTTAPELPATTLAEDCYYGMFFRCSSLNYIKCLATDISATECTKNWLDGVSSSGTFEKASSMNNWPTGASGIPSGWTVTNAQTNQTKRTIHVATAGTLPDLISKDEKYKIEELTLTGELNGTDFRFIRDMAGGGIDLDDLWKPVYTDGQLKRLDISDVSIKKGGTFYYYKIVGDNEECYTKDNTLTPFLFGGCRTLSEVRLPKTVTSIDEYAFYECNSLAAVTISNKVEYISNIAFYYISTLSVIKVDDGNRVYDSRNNCNAIISTASNELIIGCKNTTIPNSVTSIGKSAFVGCTGLASITIPNSVTSIGVQAFFNCTGLASITIPNSVTSIDNMAFWRCSGLTSITIPNSVKSIGSSAFLDCSGLTSIKVESGNQTYDSRNNCNAIIEKSTNTLIAGCKNTIIPNGVTSIGSSAFSGCNGLTSVTIPSSVTSIGSSAFSGCNGLTSVTIPNSVTSIGIRAFHGCYGLTTVTIPNSLTSIGREAFYGCSSLTSVTIPNSVISIGSSAFSGTAWYNNQPDGLVYAGKIAYKYKGMMPANTSVIIKDGTLGITSEAFSGCSGLTSITIPNSVTSIGSYAFEKCSGLTSIISQINNPFEINSVFPSIYSTATLTVPFGTKSLYEATNGWKMFSKIIESPAEKRTIHVATAGTLPDLISDDEKYQIEELTLTGELNGTDFKFIREMAGDIVSLDYYPFTGETVERHNPTEGMLKSLDISNAKIVKGGDNYNYIRNLSRGVSGLSTLDNKITPGLFYQTNLESIILPNSITSIDGKSYEYKYVADYHASGGNEEREDDYIGAFPQSLTSINIPNSVTSIGEFAFMGCSGLTSITIPNSVTSIGCFAFGDCSSLASITVPNSLISIDGGAFYSTAWYNNQPDGLVYVGKVAYDYKGEMPANTTIIIKDGTLGIAGGAFSWCKGLTSVTIPNSVTSIGSSAFYECSGLTSVTIPNSVTSIGVDAFESCKGLTSVTIPNSVKSIGSSTFAYCSGLTSVTIPNSVTSIGESAFLNCSGLTSVTIPNSVTSIGDCAFYSSGLTSVTISNSVTLIGRSTFHGCTGLTSVTIPNSVTSIGFSAFYGCKGLATISIPSSVTSIGNQAFDNCSGLTKVVSKINNPFTIVSSVFPSDIYANAELIVPAGTKSLYEAADGWNKFSKITELLPTLETQPAQPTSTTKARLIALANEEDDDQHYGFEWLRYDAPQEMPANKVSAPLYEGRIIGSLGGLNPDIYYKYRPFYKSDSGEMAYGEWIPFLTGDANVFFEPEVHTKEAIVSNDGALLSAVFVEGTEEIQEKGFEYWQKNSNARAVSLTRGNNIGSVIVSGNNTSVTIEGLKAGTEYGYRSYVKTASGITYGEEKTFKTSMFGDVNGDNKVDNNDLNDLVSYIMGNIPAHFNKDAADLNNDSVVNAADIVKMVKILK